MKYTKTLILVLLITKLACFSYAQLNNFPLDTTVRTSGNFNLINLSNQKINSDDIKGRVVILYFWSLKYKLSIEGILELNKLASKYDDKVFILGISSDLNDQLKVFRSKNNISFNLCPTPKSQYKDLVLDFNRFPAIPICFIINRNWEIVYRFVGKLEDNSLVTFEQILKKQL
ncbi:MAG: TlpA family protein disulfide reductase [Cyclobacteriaceae bacterium]|nr:TlpA family protein disulfide reductase [Cyclobacteriaceae bacterium]